MKCIKCDKDAVWVRSTQFAGDHPYCEEHAKKESDFGENDSYTYWYKVKKANRRVIKSKLGYARVGLGNV
jgi:hypothetical protein